MHEPVKGSVYAIRENYRRHLATTDSVEYDIYRREPDVTYCICYNDVRAESDDPYCTLCDGTGVSTGYYLVDKINIRIMNPKTETVLIKETFGEMDVDMRSLYGWTLYSPVMKTEDVIVERFSGKAYELQNVLTSMIGDQPIRQTFQAKLNTRIPMFIEEGGEVI